MIRKLFRLVRLALVALVVGCVVTPATAQPRTGLRHTAPDVDYDRTTPREKARSERPPGDPEMGWVWVAVGVAILIFLAWVAVRIGDNDR